MLDSMLAKLKMLSMNFGAQKQERLTREPAGEALLCVEAWQSGLLHRAYPSADVWASKALPTVSGCVNPRKGGVIATKGADRPLLVLEGD